MKPAIEPYPWVRVHLPIELCGGPLARAVALVQAERFCERHTQEHGQVLGIKIRWHPAEARRDQELWLLNRHLTISRAPLSALDDSGLAQFRALLVQLLIAGPDRDRALDEYLPRSGEGLQAAAERLWSARFPGLEFEAGPEGPAAAQLPAGAPAVAEFGFQPQARTLPKVWLIGSATERALERLGLDLKHVLEQPFGEQSAAPAGPPPAVIAELLALGDELKQAVNQLRPAIAEIDRALGVQARRTATEIHELLTSLAERAGRVHRNSTGSRRRHHRRLANALWPLGHPQIEVLPCLQYAALYGDGWLQALKRGLDTESPELQAIRIDSRITEG